MNRSLAIALAAVSGVLAGCTTTSFQPQFKAPETPKPAVVASQLAQPKPRTDRPVAVGLTTDPMRLFAWDLTQSKLLWELPVEAKSAPLVASDAVILREADGVAVRDLATGKLRVIADDKGGALIGADGQGGEIVVSIAYENKAAPGALVLVEGDRVRWKQTLNLPVGVPAISGPYVLVPWATQRLSVLATSDGAELARAHYKSSVMGEAVVDRGQLYVGQLGLMPVTAQLLEQPNLKHVPYTPLKRSLPGQPPLLRDGYAPVPDPDNAYHRLQLTWRIHREGEALSTENDTFLLRFYRLLYALNASADEIRWVRTFDHDLVAVATQPGGSWIADASGTLRYLDADGVTRLKTALGRELRALTLRTADFTPAADPGPAIDSDPAALAERPQGDLKQQLTAAAKLDDDRLGQGRAYAATNLNRFSDADTTAQLIALCSARKSPEPVRAAACLQLRDRTTGQDAVLAALRVRASFLEGTDAPPVGPLAQAAAKLQLKAAGPLLVSHVEDPNTPARDLVAVFESLEALNERSAAPSVERFVRLHHAEPEGSELLPALASGLRALAALRAKAQRVTLADIAADPLTPKPTREEAQAALVALDAPPPKPTAAAEPPPPPVQEEVQTDPRPYALTAEVVQKSLVPVRDRLKRCLAGDPSKPHVGRTSMVIDASGHVEGVFVMPATLQACVEPIVRGAQFPATRLGRQRVTHVFTDAKK
jgi:hypothetical protein